MLGIFESTVVLQIILASSFQLSLSFHIVADTAIFSLCFTAMKKECKENKYGNIERRHA